MSNPYSQPRYQTKIFDGSFDGKGTADERFNAWIKDHPRIEIFEFCYQQLADGKHSIAILYKERCR